MDQKNISPNPQQPVDRQPAGKLPNLLAELEEASLSADTHALPTGMSFCTEEMMMLRCSYDGAEGGGGRE